MRRAINSIVYDLTGSASNQFVSMLTIIGKAYKIITRTFFKVMSTHLILKRSFTYFCIYALIFAPWMSLRAETGITVDPNASAANQSIMDKTANNTPLQNIATPNAAGLSHNKFLKFNVGKKGLVVNNSKALTTSTHLGGTISANPNLKNSNAATIILNEVNGSARTNLLGPTEIAGQRADYIVANPNGISCNGCGFINTPRATLSTGVPELDSNGMLKSFNVNRGDVIISGSGLNALGQGDVTGADIVDIVARQIKINADATLQAKELNIIAGRNQVDYETREAVAKADNGTSVDNAIEIDSSLLGGMYADKITIVATEAGVGVRNDGTMSAGIGSLTLSADGKISINNRIESKANINMASHSSDIEISGTTYAKDNLEVESKRGTVSVADKSTVASGKNVVVNANSADIKQGSTILSGLNPSGTLNTTGDLSINATQRIDNAGTLLSAGKMALTAVNGLGNSGKLSSQDNLSIQTNNSVSNSGEIVTNKALIIDAANQITNDGEILAGKTTTLNANTLTTGNQSKLLAQQDLGIYIIDNIKNLGDIGSNDAVTITSNNLSNDGAITANDTLDVTTGDIDMGTGSRLIATGTLNLNANGNITNDGKIASNDVITINSKNITNSSKGELTTLKDLYLNANGHVVNRGFIGTNAQLDVTQATSLDNSGKIHAGATKIIVADDVINDGELLASKTLSINADTLTTSNQSKLLVEDALDITITNDIVNQGDIGSNDAITIDAKDIANRDNGVITAVKDLLLNASGDIVNRGTLYSEKKTDIQSDNLRNNGEIVAHSEIKIVSDKNLNNYGAINSQGNAILLVGNDLNNQNIDQQVQSATIVATGLSLDVTGDINNSGSIYSTQLANITANNIDNSGSLETRSGLSINANGTIVNSGNIRRGNVEEQILKISNNDANNVNQDLEASSGLEINANGTFKNEGELFSDATASISATGIENTGDIVAKSKLIITDHDTMTNSGQIRSLGEVTLNIDNDIVNNAFVDNNKSGLIIGSNVFAHAANNIHNSGVIYGTNEITINANSLNNDGSVLAESEVTIVLEKDLNNTGNIQSENSLTISAKNNVSNSSHPTTNQFGLLAAKIIDINVEGDITNSGTINSTATSTIDTQNFTNLGEVYTQEDLTITAAQNLDNTGVINAEGILTLNTGQDFTNKSKSGVNQSGMVEGDQISITSGGYTRNEGSLFSVAADGSVTIDADGIVNTGIVSAESNIELTSKKEILNKEGILVAGNNIIVETNDLIHNDEGIILATGDINIKDSDANRTGDFINDSAVVESIDGSINIRKENVINKKKEFEYDWVVTQAHTTTFAESEEERGGSDGGTIWHITKINHFNDYEIVASIQKNSNASRLQSGQDLKFEVANIDNQYSDILAGNNIIFDNVGSVTNQSLSLGREKIISWEGGRKVNNYNDPRWDDLLEKDSEAYKSYTNVPKSRLITQFPTISKNYVPGSYVPINKKYDFSYLSDIRQIIDSSTVARWEKQGLKDLLLRIQTSGSVEELNDGPTVTNYSSRPDVCAGKTYCKLVSSDIDSSQSTSFEAGGSIIGSVTGGLQNIQNTTQGSVISASGMDVTSLKLNSTDSNAVSNVIPTNIATDNQQIVANKDNNKIDTGIFNIDIGNPNTGVISEINNVAISNNVLPNIPEVDLSNLSQNITGFKAQFQPAPSQEKFIFETRAPYINLNSFMGSEYFLQRLVNVPGIPGTSFDPDKILLRLGDAYLDTLIIADELRRRTGRTYSFASIDETTELMRTLIDNAVAVGKEMNLVPGITLTRQQAIALGQDIVWFETVRYDGKEVLAPRLYLAGGVASRYDEDSALFGAGKDIDLKVGLLENQGTMVAGRDIAITGKGDIINRGGLIYGDSDVTLKSTEGNIRNITKNLNLQANNQIASFTIDGTPRYIDADQIQQFTNGISKSALLAVISRGEIGAGAMLSLDAKSEIDNIGSTIKAKDGVKLIAGDSINIAAQQERRYRTQKGFDIRGHVSSEKINQIGSDIGSGGEIVIASNKDIYVQASDIIGEGNVALSAGDEINLESAANSSSYDSHQGNTTEITRNTQHVKSNVVANNGNVDLTAGTGISIEATDIVANNDININSEGTGNININSATDTEYYFRETKKSGLLGSKQTIDEISSGTNVASNLQAGGDILINVSKGENQDGVQTLVLNEANSDVAVVGSNLNADGDIIINGSNDVTIAAASEWNHERHEKHKSMFGGLMSSGSVTIKREQILAKGGVLSKEDAALLSGGDVTSIASNIDAKNITVIAGVGDEGKGNINVLGDTETKELYQETYDMKFEFDIGSMLTDGPGNEFKIYKETDVHSEKEDTYVGSTFNAEEALRLSAKENINIKGSELSADQVIIQAGLGGEQGDVNIYGGTHSKEVIDKNTKAGMLGVEIDAWEETFTVKHGERDKSKEVTETYAGAKISGNDINILSLDNVEIKGSEVVANNALNIDAGGNIKLTSGENRHKIEQTHEELNFAAGIDGDRSWAGTEVVRNKHEEDHLTASGSNVAATNADLQADKNITLVGSTLSGGKVDLNAGQDIEVLAAIEKHQIKEKDITIRHGVQVVVNSGYGDAGKNIKQGAKKAANSETSDGQKAGLVQMAQGGLQAYQSSENGGGGNVSASVGGFTEYSEYESNKVYTTAKQSAIITQGDQTLTANNDATIKGSQLSSGGDIKITAGNDVNIESAQTVSGTNAKNKYLLIYGGVGVAVGNGAGIGGNFGFNYAAGKQTWDITEYQESYLDANDNLIIKSNADTNIEGAQLRGNKIDIDTGGNLNIVSQQDTTAYKNKQRSANLDVTVGFGYAAGSIGYHQTKEKYNHASVNEVTGIYADEQATITVSGNTHLKGAQVEGGTDGVEITSDTITFENVQNKEEYKAQSIGASISYSSGGDGGLSGSPSFAKDSESNETITYAAIGEGTIITNSDISQLSRDVENAHTALEQLDLQARKDKLELMQRAVALANTAATIAIDSYQQSELEAAEAAEARGEPDSVVNQHKANAAAWDKGSYKSILTKAAAASLASLALSGDAQLQDIGVQAASQLAYAYIGDFAKTKRDEALVKITAKKDKLGSKNLTEAEKTKLDQEIKALQAEHDAWADGSARKVFAHAITGGAIAVANGGEFLEGALAGGATEFTVALLTKEFGEAGIDNSTTNALAGLIGGSVSALAGGSFGQGQQIAQVADEYNRQLHPDEAETLDKEKAKLRESGLDGEALAEAERKLDAVFCAEVRCAEGVSTNDPYYEEVSALQNYGDELRVNNDTLYEQVVTLKSSQPKDFLNYTLTDSLNDWVSSNEQTVHRVLGGVQTTTATVGTIGGVVITVTSAPTCPATGVGCLVTVGGVALTALESQRFIEGLEKATGDFEYSSGKRVLDSFSSETHQGEYNPTADALTYAGISIVEVGVGKAAIKTAQGVKAIDDIVKEQQKAIDDVWKKDKAPGKGAGVNLSSGHPLGADAIPRNGARPLYGQGPGTVTCGHNSCGMVLDTLGKPKDPAKLISQIPPSEKGITSFQIKDLFTKNDVSAVAFNARTVGDLARYTSNGTPAVVRITGEKNFSHFVVVDGVTKRNGIDVVAIRDPAGSGHQYFSPVSTFKNHFTGEVVKPK